MLYTFEASTTRSREKSYNFVQGLASNVVAALRASLKNVLENIPSAVLSSKLYTVVARNERECITRLHRWTTGLLNPCGLYKEQERDKIVKLIEVTAAAQKSLSSSDSGSSFHFATVFAPQNLNRERLGSSLVFLERNVAVLLQASKPYLRLHCCRSSAAVHASNSDISAPFLNRTVQLVSTNLP